MCLTRVFGSVIDIIGNVLIKQVNKTISAHGPLTYYGLSTISHGLLQRLDFVQVSGESVDVQISIFLIYVKNSVKVLTLETTNSRQNNLLSNYLS